MRSDKPMPNRWEYSADHPDGPEFAADWEAFRVFSLAAQRALLAADDSVWMSHNIKVMIRAEGERG